MFVYKNIKVVKRFICIRRFGRPHEHRVNQLDSNQSTTLLWQTVSGYKIKLEQKIHSMNKHIPLFTRMVLFNVLYVQYLEILSICLSLFFLVCKNCKIYFGCSEVKYKIIIIYCSLYSKYFMKIITTVCFVMNKEVK